MPADKPKHFVTPEKEKEHALMLANRVRKRFDHFKRRFAREHIDCFRLYDWDIPEIRAVVDWYAGHIVVGEYVREQTGPGWLPAMAASVSKALKVPAENTHVRRRRTAIEDEPRYKKMGSGGERFKVRERDLQFWVNLEDYLDTGLFSDHRDTRVIVRELAKDKDFLNLFAYTGAFTCAAAAGGAKTTTSVDRSETYLGWAGDNLQLNGFFGKRHQLIRADVSRFLAKSFREKKKFTLCFVDPPSFFQDKGKQLAFDVNEHHPDLLRDVFKVMAPGALVFFSTNHQRFMPRLEGLPVKDLTEITPATIPEDYRNRKIHRCWRMAVAGCS